MTTDEPKPRAPAPALQADACERDLGRNFPGFALLDRDLALTADESAPSMRRVDWIGVDATGRAVLVLFVDGHAEETILLALDAITFARASGTELAEHLTARAHASGRAVDRARVPLTVLVAESFDPRVLRALSPLSASAVALLEIGVVRTQAGTHTTLRAAGSAPAASDLDSTGLIESWPAALRAGAEQLARRLARLGSDVRCVATSDALCWMIAEEPLVWVRNAEGMLVGGLSACADARSLAAESERERFLDDVVRAYVRRDAESEAAAAMPAGDLLTPEEIAAFHD
ncbi:MAG: hypothetical protein ACKVWV_17665 [Planctomycetota bacterium]